ncbi:MAG: 3-phosphoshikimate 1-carboxyvinyltransferase [Bacteroidales bacterium]|nr:3-phosphoshikimate 1-carboxyvinyltransferase [Bacteroidales bacterium]
MKIKSTFSELSGTIRIPASKSHTIRAFAIAGMADGISVLNNPLISADTQSCISGITKFGATVTEGESYSVKGIGGRIAESADFIDVGNSGTSLRILSALASLSNYEIRFDGDHSIRKRIMTPLLSSLQEFGAKVTSNNNKCPFTLKGPVHGGKTSIDGISSQFLTGLLIASPLMEGDSEISVYNLHEKPYVEITLDWLRKQNIRFEHQGLEWFKVYGGQHYSAFERAIPADFSSATFAVCAAAITGSEIIIQGLDFSDHQGDKQVFDYLKEMGLQIRQEKEGLWVKGGKLAGIEIDMNDTPDALPAMAVVGCFASGTTKLLNVAQARLKECDRISAATAELKKMGAKIEELEDGMIIHQSDLNGTVVHGYDDHRMVMALALAGFAASGETVIDTAESIRITYPSFVEDMKNLGAQIQMFE